MDDLIVDCLRVHGPTSASDVAARTGLAVAYVERRLGLMLGSSVAVFAGCWRALDLSPTARLARMADSVCAMVHGLTSQCPANDDAHSAPEPLSGNARLRSLRRASVRDEVAPALDAAMGRAGVGDPEVAAEIDEAPQRVAKMRAKAMPLTVEHLALLARSRDERLRQVFDDVMSVIDGRRGAPRSNCQ